MMLSLFHYIDALFLLIMVNIGFQMCFILLIFTKQQHVLCFQKNLLLHQPLIIMQLTHFFELPSLYHFLHVQPGAFQEFLFSAVPSMYQFTPTVSIIKAFGEEMISLQTLALMFQPCIKIFIRKSNKQSHPICYLYLCVCY